MSKELCYYSFSADEIQVDDSYDLIFEKEYEEEPFWGIMRVTFTRSTAYINFFECLVSQGGYEIFMELLQKKDVPVDTMLTLMVIFGYTSFMVPRMGLKRYLPQLL